MLPFTTGIMHILIDLIEWAERHEVADISIPSKEILFNHFSASMIPLYATFSVEGAPKWQLPAWRMERNEATCMEECETGAA